MAETTFNIKITAQNRNALEQIKKSFGGITKEADKSGKSIDNVGKRFKQLFGLIVGSAALRKAINEYNELDQATARLNSNLQRYNQLTDENIKKLREQSDRLASVSSQTRANVQNIQAAFAGLGFGIDTINELSEATVELARTTGRSADQIQDALIRAFSTGQFNSLAIFDLNSRDFTGLLNELRAIQVQADNEFVKTGSSVRDLFSEIGRFLNDALKPALTSIRFIFESITNTLRSLNDAIAGSPVLRSVILGVTGTISAIALAGVLNKLVSAMLGLTAALSTGRLGGFLAAENIGEAGLIGATLARRTPIPMPVSPVQQMLMETGAKKILEGTDEKAKEALREGIQELKEQQAAQRAAQKTSIAGLALIGKLAGSLVALAAALKIVYEVAQAINTALDRTPEVAMWFKSLGNSIKEFLNIPDFSLKKLFKSLSDALHDLDLVLVVWGEVLGDMVMSTILSVVATLPESLKRALGIDLIPSDITKQPDFAKRLDDKILEIRAFRRNQQKLKDDTTAGSPKEAEQISLLQELNTLETQLKKVQSERNNLASAQYFTYEEISAQQNTLLDLEIKELDLQGQILKVKQEQKAETIETQAAIDALFISLTNNERIADNTLKIFKEELQISNLRLAGKNAEADKLQAEISLRERINELARLGLTQIKEQTDELKRQQDILNKIAALQERIALLQSAREKNSAEEQLRLSGGRFDPASRQKAFNRDLGDIKNQIGEQEKLRDQFTEAGDTARANEAATAIANLKREFNETAQSGNAFTEFFTGPLSDGFGDIITRSKSVSQAFSDMASSIVNSLARILTQLAVSNVLRSFFGAAGFFPGVGNATGEGLNFLGTAATPKAQGFASGGIAGRDSIPAMLTPGELILNKAQQTNVAASLKPQANPVTIVNMIDSRQIQGIMGSRQGRQTILNNITFDKSNVKKTLGRDI